MSRIIGFGLCVFVCRLALFIIYDSQLDDVDIKRKKEEMKVEDEWNVAAT